MNDRRTNLRRRLSLLRLLIGEDGFFLADVALRTVHAGEAIEQTLVPDAPIAVAVARLLI